MHYKAVKESDGTYTIRSCTAGLNYNEIEMVGVRGCNVSRILNKLAAEEYYRSLQQVKPIAGGSFRFGW